MDKNAIKSICSALLFGIFSVGNAVAGVRNEQDSKVWIQLDDGLTNNYIMSLSEDRYGGLWIGTEEGMNRFDGVDIRNYMKNSGVLTGNEINKILLDRFSDKVWVATQRAGISVYDFHEGKTWSLRYGEGMWLSLPSDEVTDIEQDESGRIWFTTYTKGAGCYDPAEETITVYDPSNVEGMDHSYFRALELGPDGKIYLASYGGGVTVLDPGARTAVRYRHVPGDPNSLPSNQIGCLYKDCDNNIWVGTRAGLALFRPVTMDFHIFNHKNTGLPDGFIMSVLVTSEKELLVSPGYNGLWRMDISSGIYGQKFERVPDIEELNNASIRAMHKDGFGNLWIGSYGHGLLCCRKDHSKFTVISDMPENSITCLEFSADGNLIAGTDGGGLNVFDGELRMTKVSDEKIFDRSIFSIHQGSDGKVWVGSFNKPVVVTDCSLSGKFEIQIPEVRDFQEQGDIMWVVSGLRGLYAVDKKTYKEIGRYAAPDHFPDNYLRNIVIDNDGNIWIGTLRCGLFVFDSEMNSIALYNADSGLPSNTVNHLMLDRKGNVWAATAEGLVRFKDAVGDEYEQIDFHSKIRSENIKAVAEDEKGMIWFSTSVSICWYDPNTNSIREFDHRSRLADGNYAPAAVAADGEGKLCFGSTKGLTLFSPEDIYVSSGSPSLHFSEMNLFDTDEPLENRNETLILAGRESVTLKHWQNNFTVSFAVDNFGISDVVEYSYKVEGRDNKWYPVDNQNEVTFRQLDPGRYKLLVRSRMQNEEWNGKLIALDITVTPPFYASHIAVAIYVIIFIILLFLIAHYYKIRLSHKNELILEKETIARIKEVNEERLRFYTNITHELRTPLTLIIGPLEDLAKDMSLPEKSRQKVSVVLKNSQILMELINKLLAFRKAETHNVQLRPVYADLSKTVEDVSLIFSEANTNRNVELVFEIEKGVMTRFDSELLATILRNLLSNAMKYTSSGYVKVSLKRIWVDNEGYADISVEDSGKGISKDNLEKIFDRYYQVAGQAYGSGIGLSLVKKYVKLHGGRIIVESELGKGSTFTVRLPMLPFAEEESELAASMTVADEADKRPQVVVVDDNDDIRKYVKGILIDQFDVYTAKNGAEGLKLIGMHIPDLVITDIMMPVMDGIQLCANIKKDLRLSHIPVILLTAKDTIEDRSEGYEAGADSYISKPFTSGIIRARVSNLIESRKKIMAQFAAAIPENKEIEVARSNYATIDNEYLKKITELIEENISSENLDVLWLADEMNMSPSTLYRKLKGLVGISANEYIRKIRMRKAATMLASGQYNVSETSWNVGISSMIYFRQCFKEEYGVSPSEYRKKATKSY